MGEGETRAYDAFPGSLRHFAEDLLIRSTRNASFLQGQPLPDPPPLCGKKVMLKIKGKIIRIFHDQDLIASYEEPETKHAIVGDPAIYRLLYRTKSEIKREVRRQKRASNEGSRHENALPRGGDQITGRIRASGRCDMEQLTYERLTENLDQAEACPHAGGGPDVLISCRARQDVVSAFSTASLRKRLRQRSRGELIWACAWQGFPRGRPSKSTTYLPSPCREKDRDGTLRPDVRQSARTDLLGPPASEKPILPLLSPSRHVATASRYCTQP